MRSVTVYFSEVSSDLVVDSVYAAFQNDDGSVLRSIDPSEPSNGALPAPEPAVTNAASDGSAPGANCSCHV